MKTYEISFIAIQTPSIRHTIHLHSIEIENIPIPDSPTSRKIESGAYKLTWTMEGIPGEKLIGEIIIKDQNNHPIRISPIKINDSIIEKSIKEGAIAPITLP
ncbi:hypothetical protein HA051_21695 [Chromobacterium vaccinii]|nr:hypothetical protein [Chromobacterium vaccinii]